MQKVVKFEDCSDAPSGSLNCVSYTLFQIKFFIGNKNGLIWDIYAGYYSDEVDNFRRYNKIKQQKQQAGINKVFKSWVK
jgi:hypothetical protein